jgi:hypothetical protein
VVAGTVSPANNAVGVSRTANFTATFSENVAGVSGTTVRLTGPGGAAVAATVSYNATTRVVTVDPTPTLAANTRFTVTITGGPAAVRDTAGNPFTTASSSFTTGAV